MNKTPPRFNRTEFAKRLRNAVNDSGRNQSELAKATYTCNATISRFMAGKGLPSAANLVNLCECLAVTPNYLLLGREDKALEEKGGPVESLKEIRSARTEMQVDHTNALARRGRALRSIIDTLQTLQSGEDRLVLGAVWNLYGMDQ